MDGFADFQTQRLVIKVQAIPAMFWKNFWILLIVILMETFQCLPEEF